METASPTLSRTYVLGDQEVLKEEALWLCLSIVLFFAYIFQRRYLSWAVVLRDIPWKAQVDNIEEQEGECTKERNEYVHLFRSLKRTLTLDEKSLISQTGLDGYLTIRLIRFCLYSIAFISLPNLTVLVPIYFSQPRSEKCEIYCLTHNKTSPPDAYRADCVCGFIDECSLGNVRANSNVLWASAVSMLIMTVWILYRLKVEYKEVVRIRHNFWSSKPSKLHTVFVDRIPRALSAPGKLQQYFEQLFPNQVHSVEIVSNIEALTHAGQERIKILRQLERAVVMKSREGNEPKHCAVVNGDGSVVSALLCCYFRRVSSIETYASQLGVLNSKFKLLRDRHIADSEQALDEISSDPRQAFVTFRMVTPSIIASQTLVQENMALKMAPNPTDVRWGNLGKRNTAFSHFCRKTFSRILFGVVVVFWGGITSALSALSSRDALAHQFSGLNDFLLEHPGFVSWLDRLSTFIYVILIALVYPIISLSVRFEVRISQSNVERAILERYFLFLVVQVFVFYSVAGSVFKSVVEIAETPSRVVTTLSTTIPKNASFFIGFIAIKTFWLFFDLIRGYNYIFAFLRRIFYGRTLTPKDFRYQFCCCCWDFRFPSPINLSSANANVLLVYFIAISYANIQPLLSVAAFIYFVSAYVCFSLILTTSSKQLFDGGGIFWTHTYWCVISSLVTAQLTLCGTLLTKEGFSQAICVFFLAVFTVVMSTHFDDKYRTAATEVTLEIAAELDKTEATTDSPLPIQIIEIKDELVFEYGVVTYLNQTEKNDGNTPREDGHDDGEEQNKNVVKVFRYVHPVLQEAEFSSPELPEMIHGIRELGEGFHGTTGGDLGYARMLDLDWNSTGLSANNQSQFSTQ